MRSNIATIKGFIDFVYDFYNTMKDHQVSLVYEGVVTHDIVKAFSALAEANMGNDDENTNVQKKVYHVLVECLQNISKHSDFQENSTLGRGVFIVSRSEDQYLITTGNMVENSRIEKLKGMLEHINSLDKEGLKQLYKEQMVGGTLSEKGGAGLGFISIVKRTGEKLDYNFQEIDANNSFFILSSRITRQTI